MDDHIRTAMAAYEPKRIKREGIERAAVLVAKPAALMVRSELT